MNAGMESNGNEWNLFGGPVLNYATRNYQCMHKRNHGSISTQHCSLDSYSENSVCGDSANLIESWSLRCSFKNFLATGDTATRNLVE